MKTRNYKTALRYGIFCPIDESESSHKAFEHALAFALRMNTKLCLLNVSQDVESTLAKKKLPSIHNTLIQWGLIKDKSQIDSFLSDRKVSIVKLFSESHLLYRTLLNEVNTPGVKISPDEHLSVTYSTKQGDLIEMIVETANDSMSDLIVMQTEGHNSLADMILGSKTEKVIRQAPCPVLALPV